MMTIFYSLRKKLARWYNVEKKKRGFISLQKKIKLTQYSKSSPKKEDKILILMIDEYTPQGGLVDKLKGIMTGNAIAKKIGYKFKVYIKPGLFPIQKFLKSNEDFYIFDREIISFNADQSAPFVLYNYNPSRIEQTLKRFSIFGQVHLYCNLDLIPSLTQGEFDQWGKLFNKTFSFDSYFSSRLKELHISGSMMIGIHYRFLSGLGDFKDSGTKRVLNRLDQEKLINKCLQELSNILHRHPECETFLIFSDSVRFLEHISINRKLASYGKKLIFDNSNIGHTGLVNEETTLQRAILDFFYLSKCDKIYRVVGKGMHLSDFSKYASHLNSSKFDTIRIDH